MKSNTSTHEETLTKAELEVLLHIQLPEKLIAEKLFRSPNTIRRHMFNIRTKLRKANKAELAVWAAKKGVI
ncbi:response regulator transcription factor [Olivibacter sp. LS-1]|uniref:response regulator transcription factor n=1 Tax=Olivibacter sp. LS-1 TaxID=2592345 RepID=UPI0011EB405A|nr:LuxR C-terminal-related transcriptional regulator [Olivibacter sp. LS-1]QEL01090.1 response regulator transcription factor [Olivibacter sp. LS-1]